MERGEAYNKERARQGRDFTGLRYGAITPTDIDAFIDFGNHLFIMIEAKYNGTELPYGQRLALERLCDAANETVRSFVLIVSHNQPPNEEIDFAAARAVEYRWNHTWVPIQREATCSDFVDAICERYLEEPY